MKVVLQVKFPVQQGEFNMAKLHSKKKGKSGTKRPKSKIASEFVSIEPEEIKKIIRELAKENVPQTRIGLILRDKYGVASIRSSIGVTISQFLKKENMSPEYPDDLLTLIKKAVRMRDHLKSKKKDLRNKVKLTHVESKIQRLVVYYSRKGRIPQGWRYDPEKVALLVK